jgi:hypothetical protein
MINLLFWDIDLYERVCLDVTMSISLRHRKFIPLKELLGLIILSVLFAPRVNTNHQFVMPLIVIKTNKLMQQSNFRKLIRYQASY